MPDPTNSRPNAWDRSTQFYHQGPDTTPRDLQMEVFDLLPQSIRIKLADSPLDFDALSVLAEFEQGKSVSEVSKALDMIIRRTLDMRRYPGPIQAQPRSRRRAP